MTPTNKDRAKRAGAALLAHQVEDCFGDKKQARVELKSAPAAILSYVLADLRHWCDERGFDFARIDRDAYQVYLNELHEERQARKEKRV